jgi:FkbM family methyltransferase
MNISTKSKIAIASVISKIFRTTRSMVGLKNKTQFKRGGIIWDLDLTQGIDFAIFLQGGFEPETIKTYKKYVDPGTVVLDIGANIGAHTLPLAKMVGETGKVIAFEPTDYAFGKLKNNLSLNGALASRVTAIQALLVGTLSEEIPEAIPSSWPLERIADNVGVSHPIHGGTFNTLSGAIPTRLDEWFEKNPEGHIEFIKMDVDGYEIGVLEGASQTLTKHRPVIVMEFAPYIFEERGRKFSELVDFLRDHNYACCSFGGSKLPLDKSLESQIGYGCSINVILKPV